MPRNDPLSSHEDKLAISFRLFSQVITKFIVGLSAEAVLAVGESSHARGPSLGGGRADGRASSRVTMVATRH